VVSGSNSSTYSAHLVWHDRNANWGLYQIWHSALADYSPSATWTSPAVAVADNNRSAGLPAIALGTTSGQTHLAFVKDAKGATFRDIDVWYAGANGNRINDPDDKIWLPLVFKN
jgi:hypothetical protein